MDQVLIDTDILSELLKAKDARVLKHAGGYLANQNRITFSAITLYEIVRGFRATGAMRQLANFLALTESSEVLPVSAAVLDRAASLWAEAYQSGQPRDDADLIIAATALEARRVLVTGNTSHFNWIPQLRLADWRS